MTDKHKHELSDIYNYAPYVAAGGLLFFSGVVAMGPNGQAPADPQEQFAQVFVALDSVLASAGVGKDHLVDLLTFHASYPEHMEAFMAAKNAYLGALTTAWTAVGVQALGTPETLVEIRAVARQ